ncbi:hypothetical protein K1719_007695 [Acacia pycnantha]|nr:hypothetical protein K1719_007695 [Acacia pycnantha]
MAIVVSSKSSVLVPPSVEDDDLLHRSSKKIKNGECSVQAEEWPSLSRNGTKTWGAGMTFAEKLQGINQGGVGATVAGEGKFHADDDSSDSVEEDSEMEDSEPLSPWMLYDHYLTVRPWEPEFHPEKATIDKVVVWVRMPKVALEYYDKEALEWIGDRIGETIKVDFNTSCQLRGHYARVCVLVDLTKQLTSGFVLDGELYYLEYEGLHGLCIHCGIYGHKSDSCKSESKLAKVDDKEPVEKKTGVVGETMMEEVVSSEQDTWKIVKKVKWKKKNNNTLGKEKGVRLIRSRVMAQDSVFCPLGLGRLLRLSRLAGRKWRWMLERKICRSLWYLLMGLRY